MENNKFENDDYPPDLYSCVHEFPQIMQNDEEFLRLKYFFERDGYILTGDDIKFYTPELAYILMFSRFERFDYERRCYVTDRIEFYHCYIDAFKSEQQNFDNKIANRQYPKNTEEYNLFITYLQDKLNGCKIIFQNPDTITYKLCKEYGQFAGLFSRIKEIIDDDINLQQRINKLNQSDKNKPEPKPQRTIKVEDFKTYFKPSFFGVGNGAINYFEWMIEHLQQERNKIEFAQIALMIFESNKALKPNPKQKKFSKWYRIFCECVGCDKSTYKLNDLKPIPDNLTKLFNYL